MVSDPLTVRDCCLVLDGGGAMIVTSAARARDCRRVPIHVLGTGEAIGHGSISNMADLTATAAAVSGPRAFAAAGVGPGDIDVALLYDAFTITPILFLEDLGFCAKGEGGAFVQDGGIAPGGRLAVNTNGGGLSYYHPGMYGLLAMIECVRQLRGECGARQVARHDIALAHGNGGGAVEPVHGDLRDAGGSLKDDLERERSGALPLDPIKGGAFEIRIFSDDIRDLPIKSGVI